MEAVHIIMFTAFNLNEIEKFEDLNTISEEDAKKEYEKNRDKIIKNISVENILSNATLTTQNKIDESKIDADQVQQSFFPTNAYYDVFISHSHQDLALAQKLALYLKQNMGVEAFIDSEVWGYYDDLLKYINDEYAQIQPGLYDYRAANINAINISLMLSNALHDMIDKTECLFFLNTPNSINVGENIQIKNTSSPWIYDEIKTVATIRKRKPKRWQDECKTNRNRPQMKPQIPDWIRSVDQELTKFYVLSNERIRIWKLMYNARAGSSLDSLYMALRGKVSSERKN